MIKHFRNVALGIALFTPLAAQADFSETFEDLALPGWVKQNNSSPAGTTAEWGAPNVGDFTAHEGSDGSYIAVDFESAAFGGDISNWLLTPAQTFQNGDVISFYSRTVDDPSFPDRLEVRLSTSGVSTDVGNTVDSVGDFGTLLLTINEGLSDDGYPDDWTQFIITVSGLSTATSGRLGFRYFVPDTSTNADYIGVDTLTITVVPEPSQWALMLGGLVMLGGLALRKRRA